MALNKQRELFANEYFIDLNATQAAIRAGYSEKTAYSQGQRLLKNVEVQEYLEKLMDEKKQQLIMKQDEVLERLTRIGRREEMEYQVVTLKTKESKWVNIGTEENPSMKKQSVDTEEEKIVPIPAKLSDTNKALELLGKRYAMWTDKKEIDLTEQVVFVGEDELED